MKKFKHVIIWGHKLHSHTHSYIHNAFFRAFQNLGYDTHWIDDHDYNTNSMIRSFDFNNCLFLTEGQVCNAMPILASSKYILHNCYDQKLWDKINETGADFLKIQVYTNDVLNYNIEKLENGIYLDSPGKMLYMPWATDLLPIEIIPFPLNAKTNKCWWVGTIGDGQFGNRNEINAFTNACRENGVSFEHASNISIEENRQRIAESYMVPAIVGTWQKQKGYIPCRIFKNVSYGQFGITNSKVVHELFEEKTIYSEYEHELFELMVKKMLEPTYKNQLADMIKFVKTKHTYINRINTILQIL